MVDQLSSFAGEVTRVARKSVLKDVLVVRPSARVSGTWKDLTDYVNSTGR